MWTAACGPREHPHCRVLRDRARRSARLDPVTATASGWNSLACAASSSTFLRARQADHAEVSAGIARTTSRVLLPIDPVLPRTMILFTPRRPLPADQEEEIVEKGRREKHRIHRVQHAAARRDDDARNP